jgi:hypothetical protein
MCSWWKFIVHKLIWWHLWGQLSSRSRAVNVGLRAGLKTETVRKISYLCRGSNPGSPICSQTLHWLSYASSHYLQITFIRKVPESRCERKVCFISYTRNCSVHSNLCVYRVSRFSLIFSYICSSSLHIIFWNIALFTILTSYISQSNTLSSKYLSSPFISLQWFTSSVFILETLFPYSLFRGKLKDVGMRDEYELCSTPASTSVPGIRIKCVL